MHPLPTCMLPVVSLEMGRLQEGCPTHAADVRPLPCVLSGVLHKVRVLRERVAALFTHKRLDVQVEELVLLHSALLGETLPAVLAQVGFLAGV